MAQVQIKIIRAYDSSSNGMIGTSIPELFRPLQTPVMVDETKAAVIAAKAQEISEKYAAEHPGESFMPFVSVKIGRTPTNLKKTIDAMERQWLKVSHVDA